MPAATVTPPRVGLRADASTSVGVGHVARLLALADEIVTRGGDVVLFGTVEGAAWLSSALAQRGVQVRPAAPDPDGLAAQLQEAGCVAAVLDGYHLDPGTGARLRREGCAVLALQDAQFGAGQDADVVLDQNVGADRSHVRADAAALLGLDFVLIRDEVLAARAARAVPAGRVPHVLVFCGGTDPRDAAPSLAELVLSTGVAVHLRVIAVRDSVRAALGELERSPGQTLEVLDPSPRVAELAAASDAAVIAAGSSLWELLCIGVPTAVVAVADNQRPTLSAVGPTGAALSLGPLDAVRENPATARDLVHTLLSSEQCRADLSARATALVDGRGRERVLDALLSACEARRAHGQTHPSTNPESPT